jgi:hypothetical protein
VSRHDLPTALRTRIVSALSPFRILSSVSPRARRTTVWALFVLLAALDLATSPDLSFLVFYLLPVLLAAWYLGPREGLLVSAASIAVFVADDLVTRRAATHPAASLWNHGGELTFFVFFSWLVGTLHTAFEREAAARTERLERDLALATEVQAALLPPRSQEGTEFLTAAECRQALGVGGDAWDVTSIGEGAICISIADVSGKGLPAALLMAGFLGFLRGLLPAGAGRLPGLAAELSEKLRLAAPERRFVTAFLAVAQDGVLRYVNAGHEPGILLPPGPHSGAHRWLPSTGPPLGLLPRASFREESVPFPPGSSLILYTDGLTECENPRGIELGRDHLFRLAASLAGAPPAAVVRSLLAAAEEHLGGAPPQDDVTVVCLSRRGPGTAGGASPDPDRAGPARPPASIGQNE